MKKGIIGILLMCISWTVVFSQYEVAAKVSPEISKLKLENIKYEMPIVSPYGPCPYDWWQMNMENSKLYPFRNRLIKLVYTGKIQVYDNLNKPLTVEQAKDIGSKKITIVKINEETFEHYDSLFVLRADAESIKKLYFKETWDINYKTFEISKHVTGFCPVYDKYNELGDKNGEDKLYWFNSKKKQKGKKEVLTELIAYDVFFNRGKYKKNALNLNKIDLRAYSNNLIKAAYSDKIKIIEFTPVGLSDIPLEKDRLRKELESERKITITIPETLEEYDSTYTEAFNSDNIVGIRFLEKWLINNETMEMEKKVIGICPIEEVITDEGKIKGYKPLFWVYFDDKYIAEIIEKYKY